MGHYFPKDGRLIGLDCICYIQSKEHTRNTPMMTCTYYLAIIEFGFLRIWRILQIREGVIHSGRRPRWITLSETCRIFHILRKRNSIIALLFIQNIFPFLKEFRNFAPCFFRSLKAIPSRPQVFSVNGSMIWSGLHFESHFDFIGSIICSGLHFWRHWFNMRKILLKFGQQQLVLVNYACGFNQSETGKYFEWIISMGYWPSVRSRWLDIGQVLFLRVYGPRLRRGP